MAVTAAGLSSAVYATHLASFPLAATVTRLNSATGVTPHIPAQELIRGLCTAVATVATQLTYTDAGTGTADVPGVSAPTTFTIPGRAAAITGFLSQQGWTGPDSVTIANILIGGPLDQLTLQGLLVMQPNPTVGTGVGIVSGATNGSVQAAATSLLEEQLPLALQATGAFGEGDVPANPINSTLLAQLPAYVSAYATALATLTAQVVYTGNASSMVPSAGANTGSIQVDRQRTVVLKQIENAVFDRSDCGINRSLDQVDVCNRKRGSDLQCHLNEFE